MKMNVTTDAMIHSLEAIGKVTILEKKEGNNYIAIYRNKVCTAIFNCITGMYYVDDKYGVIELLEDEMKK